MKFESPADAALSNRSIGANAPAAAFCYIQQNRIRGFCFSEVKYEEV